MGASGCAPRADVGLELLQVGAGDFALFAAALILFKEQKTTTKKRAVMEISKVCKSED